MYILIVIMEKILNCMDTPCRKFYATQQAQHNYIHNWWRHFWIICISIERQHEEKYFDKKILNIIPVLKAKVFLNLDIDVIRFSLKLEKIFYHSCNLENISIYKSKVIRITNKNMHWILMSWKYHVLKPLYFIKTTFWSVFFFVLELWQYNLTIYRNGPFPKT